MQSLFFAYTLKILKLEKFTVIILKFEQGGFTVEQKMQRELQTV